MIKGSISKKEMSFLKEEADDEKQIYSTYTGI